MLGEINTAVVALDATKSLIKTVLDIADSTKNLDLKSNILDLKEIVLALRDENIALREELKKQESYNMVFEKNLYYNIKDNGQKEGPYCTKCFDVHKKAIRMHDDGYSYICPECHVCVTYRPYPTHYVTNPYAEY